MNPEQPGHGVHINYHFYSGPNTVINHYFGSTNTIDQDQDARRESKIQGSSTTQRAVKASNLPLRTTQGTGASKIDPRRQLSISSQGEITRAGTDVYEETIPVGGTGAAGSGTPPSAFTIHRMK